MKTALEGPVRVRFAPSPTGFLHVGGARTAIYNDLLRQSLGGVAILRIEDTDQARSDEAMTRQIQTALDWLGTVWDEGPYLQSERLGRHRERAYELLEKGRAYRCFCPKERLDELRRQAEQAGVTFRYPRTCRGLAPEAVAARVAAGEPAVVRLEMPERTFQVRDLVRGEVEIPPDTLDDFILLRSDATPTYHMSVVVDDIDMGITHVIRGEDHLSNTPKHIALFEAFDAPAPAFGHLPLILGPDRKRLSKRTGATSVEEFREQGFLPQALYNFLALLGWSPGDGREVMTRAELIEAFTVERINASAAVFDRDKLAWMNGQYLSGLPLPELLPHLRPFLAQVGLAEVDGERLARAVDLHRTRARTLADLAALVVPHFREALTYDPGECAKFLAEPGLPERLEALTGRYAGLGEFTVAAVEAALRGLAEEQGVKAGALIHPTRMALSAAAAGPPLFDLVAAMGREATVRHLANFIAFLRLSSRADPR